MSGETRTFAVKQVFYAGVGGIAAALCGAGAFAFFQPMVGGIPPAKAWESLELFAKEVLPALQ